MKVYQVARDHLDANGNTTLREWTPCVYQTEEAALARRRLCEGHSVVPVAERRYVVVELEVKERGD